MKVHRAANVLQAMWYGVRKEAFDWDLLKMTSWDSQGEDGIKELELIARDREVIEEEDGRREQVVYQAFPQSENGEGWVKEEMNAALTFGSCQFAVRMLHGPLRKMIDGTLFGFWPNFG